MTTVYSRYSAGWKPANANVYRKYRARLDYSVSAETDTTITYKAVLYVNINSSVSASYSGTLNLAGSTYSGSCETKYKSDNPVKTVTCVSAKTKTFTKGETATTANISGGVRSSNGAWTGATVTATATVTIPAKRYAITFDANGGENPPAEQKKIHGTDLTLSDVIPTKANYDFVSWNTAADGSGTSYVSGATFSTNAITTLYAQWHISYQPPQISDLRAYRVSDTASGASPDVKSNGTRCYADFIYTPSIDPDSVTNSIKIQFGSSTAVNASTSGTLRYGYSATNHLPTTSKETVTITITVTDYNGNSYTYNEATYVSTEIYIFDAFKGTSGIEEYQSFAVGGIARDFNSAERSESGNFDCYMDANFLGNLNVASDIYAQGNKILATAEKIQNMLCTAYIEELNVTAGTFTDNGCNASLVGNSLYLYINAKAKAAITAGNITNQTMLTITFIDSKIAVLYSVSTSGGATGPNSQMQFKGGSSGGQHTITVTLAAIAQNIAKGGIINAHVSIPCVLNWDAY